MDKKCRVDSIKKNSVELKETCDAPLIKKLKSENEKPRKYGATTEKLKVKMIVKPAITVTCTRLKPALPLRKAVSLCAKRKTKQSKLQSKTLVKQIWNYMGPKLIMEKKFKKPKKKVKAATVTAREMENNVELLPVQEIALKEDITVLCKSNEEMIKCKEDQKVRKKRNLKKNHKRRKAKTNKLKNEMPHSKLKLKSSSRVKKLKKALIKSVTNMALQEVNALEDTQMDQKTIVTSTERPKLIVEDHRRNYQLVKVSTDFPSAQMRATTSPDRLSYSFDSTLSSFNFENKNFDRLCYYKSQSRPRNKEYEIELKAVVDDKSNNAMQNENEGTYDLSPAKIYEKIMLCNAECCDMACENNVCGCENVWTSNEDQESKKLKIRLLEAVKEFEAIFAVQEEDASSNYRISNSLEILKFSVDFESTMLVDIFHQRGWKQVGFDDKWNIFWGSLPGCHAVFHRHYLLNNQLLNHFPNHYELTRKDLLAKNIKGYRRKLEKEFSPYAEMVNTAEGLRYVYLDIIPSTFEIPSEYGLFVEEYKKERGQVWIVKPSAGSQGVGIFLVNKPSQMQNLSYNKDDLINGHIRSETYIIQRYIKNPLLIDGRKFDLRLYVLVTSFTPFKAYLYADGFCRICSAQYRLSDDTLENTFIHLTNVSVQKQSESGNSSRNKWSIKELRSFLNTMEGDYRTSLIFLDIKWIIIHSLLAVAPRMSIEPHCFELYGYDIIIDEKFKPWLIEINASPSMTGTDEADAELKKNLIDNTLSIVLDPDGCPNSRWDKNPPKAALNKFEALHDPIILKKLFTIKNLRFDASKLEPKNH